METVPSVPMGSGGPEPARWDDSHPAQNLDGYRAGPKTPAAGEGENGVC
jgi:hypothetical protein